MGIDHPAYQDHLIKGGSDVKTLGYTELIPNLIKAIQELSQQNTDLMQRIKALENS